MELGPFAEFDIETVKSIFDAAKIKFEIIVSEEGLKALQDNRAGGRRFNAGARTIFFEIADEDFSKVAVQMERYGIVPASSDGSWELSGDDDEGPR